MRKSFATSFARSNKDDHVHADDHGHADGHGHADDHGHADIGDAPDRASRKARMSSFVYRLMLKRLGVVQTHAVSIQRNIRVRMPDGAELLTDVYLGNARGAPVVMIRSPYGKTLSFAARTAYPLAARGFNVIMQCCRGTFGSSGEFDPHHDEERDGLETLTWIKRQPWYRGAIATFGMSYLGYTQWAV